MTSDNAIETVGAVAKGVLKGAARTLAPTTSSIVSQTVNAAKGMMDLEEEEKKKDKKKVNELFGRNVLK